MERETQLRLEGTLRLLKQYEEGDFSLQVVKDDIIDIILMLESCFPIEDEVNQAIADAMEEYGSTTD